MRGSCFIFGGDHTILERGWGNLVQSYSMNNEHEKGYTSRYTGFRVIQDTEPYPASFVL